MSGLFEALQELKDCNLVDNTEVEKEINNLVIESLMSELQVTDRQYILRHWDELKDRVTIKLK